MKAKRRSKREVGDVISIPLGDGRTAFGVVLDEPLVTFFDICVANERFPSASEIAQKPVAFRVWVMNKPIVDGTWPVIGHVAVPAHLLEPPLFFKQDPISGRVTVGHTASEELLPEHGQLEYLERAAVWSANHVVDRLRDHFDGRPNKWVESMRPKT